MYKSNGWGKLLFIAMATLLLLLPLGALAETEGDYTYTVDAEAGTATLTGYTGSESALTLPAELGGYPVVTIASGAISGTTVTSVVIPEGVQTVESSALSRCSSLTLVDCPESLISLQDYFWTDGERLALKVHYGSYAHQWVIENLGTCLQVTDAIIDEASGCGYFIENGCAKVVSYSGTAKDVVVPATLGGYPVTEIGDAAFVQRNTLTSVSLPDSVTRIGDSAFAYCWTMSSIDMPANLQSIGSYAFRSATGLLSMDIPSGVTMLEEGAFYFCSQVKNFVVPSGVTKLNDVTFDQCYGATSITLPDGLTEIGYSCFGSCESLKSLEIPDGVTSIGDYAFLYCRSLESLTIPASVISMGVNTLNTGSLSQVIYVYKGSYAHTFCMENGVACELINVVPYTYTIENGEVTITGYTGTETAIEIPAEIEGCSVTAIGEEAFAFDAALTSIVIPEGVTTIGTAAFDTMTSLNSITLPSTLKVIGDNAFAGCSALTELIIPDGVTTIGFSAFNFCTGLMTVVFPGSVTNMGDSLFCACSSLMNVTLGEGLTAIPYGMFMDCGGLFEITIPDSVTEIGANAFTRCTGLRYLMMGRNVAFIGSEAFPGDNLTMYVYADTYAHGWCMLNRQEHWLRDPATIPFSYACYDGTITINSYSGADTDLVIPGDIAGIPVTVIGPDAFVDQSFITSLTLPDSLTRIESWAFARCTGLTSVILGKNLSYIYADAFAGCTNLIAHVYDGSYAHTWCVENGQAYELIDAVEPDVPDVPDIPSDPSVPHYKPGDTIVMELEITWLHGGETAEVYYNASRAPVTCISTSAAASSNMIVPPPAGQTGRFSLINISGIQTGPVGTVTFRVNDDAAPGAYVIYAWGEYAVPMNGVSGAIIFEVVGSGELPPSSNLSTFVPDNSLGLFCNTCGDAGVQGIITAEGCKIVCPYCSTERSIGHEVYCDAPGVCVVCGYRSVSADANITYVHRQENWVLETDTTQHWLICGPCGAEVGTRENHYAYTCRDTAVCAFCSRNDIVIGDVYEHGVYTSWVYHNEEVHAAVCQYCYEICYYDSHSAYCDAPNNCTICPNGGQPISVSDPKHWTWLLKREYNAQSHRLMCTNCGWADLWNDHYYASEGDSCSYCGFNPASPEASYIYTIDNGEVTINKYIGTATAIEIPEWIEGYPVTAIGGDAFIEASMLTSVTFPSTLKSIAEFGMAGCTSVTEFVVPEGVTYIGQYAFCHCDSLVSLTLPASAINTSFGIVAYDPNLTSVIFAEGTRTIPSHFFMEATSSSIVVTVPASVNNLTPDSFSNDEGKPTPVAMVYDGSYAHTWCVENGQAYELIDAVEPDVPVTGEYPESDHPYADNSDITWTYAHEEEAYALKITFSADTMFEANFDFLYVIGEDGAERKFTGTELQGNSIYVLGDSFTLRLTTDVSVTMHGFAITAVEALTQDEYEALPDYTYIIENGEVTITGYIGAETAIEIPAEIEGYPVTAIGGSAFANCSALTSVTIPAGIYAIDVSAFTNCPINMVVNVGANEYAKNWCWENGVAYDADGAAAPLTSPVTTFPTQTYLNLAEAGIDKESILASIPGMPEVQLVNGRLMVKDIGALRMSYTCWINGHDYEMTKCGDVWVVEATPSSDFTEGFVYVSGDEGDWGMSYMNLRYRWSIYGTENGLEAVTLTSRTGESMRISIDFEVMVGYALDNAYTIEDSYDYATGALKQEQVRRWNDSSYCYAIYDGTGALEYFEMWPNEGGYAWMYYPETGWQQNSTPCDAPAGFENADTAFFYENYPPQMPGAVNPYPAVPFTYIIENGEVTITGYTGEDTEAVIPETIKGYPVTAIGRYAFEANYALASIVIPETVKVIDEYAFAFCRSLTSLELPERVVTIGKGAFSGCDGLESVTLPSGLTIIDEVVFAQCYALTDIVIPAEVTSIEGSAFYYCKTLTNVELPEGLTHIGDYAFGNCKELTSLTIPASVTNMGANAFKDAHADLALRIFAHSYAYKWCEHFSFAYELIDPESALFTCSIGDTVTITGYTGNAAEVVIPAEIAGKPVTAIGDYCFMGNTTMISVVIPDTVETIGEYAFSECTALWSVYTPVSVKKIGQYAFSNCHSLFSAVISEGVAKIPYGMFAGCSALNSFIVPSSATELGGAAFSGCTALTSVTLHDGLTAINPWTFADCTSLTSISIPDSVNTIGVRAFSGCALLSSIDLPNGVTEIGDYAFRRTGLAHIEIPESVTSIGANAFSGARLAKIIFRGMNMPAIGYSAFDSALTVYCYQGSSLDAWAASCGYPVVYIDGLDPNGPITITLPASCTLWLGTPLTIEPELFPAVDASCLTWTSSDEQVATVADGVITGVSSGDAIITASYGNVSAQMLAIVRVPVDSFEISDMDICIVRDEYARVKIVNIEPADADMAFTWFIGDESIAIVDDDLLIAALTPGETTLTVCSANGMIRQARLRVFDLVTDVAFETASISMVRGDEAQLSVQVTVQDTTLTNELVTFYSSDNGVAEVLDDGRVLGVGYGTAVITAKASSGVTATCTVIVTSACDTHVEAELEGIDATCLEEGLTSGAYCTICGMVVNEQKVIPPLGHSIIQYEAMVPTSTNSGWEAYEACERCDYTTFAELPALSAQTVSSYDALMTYLPYLEQWAVEYAADHGCDPLDLVIKFIRTGDERFSTSYWNGLAGAENAGFAEYVAEKENEYNLAGGLDGMIRVSSLKNLGIMTLPNGDSADMAQVFSMMDAAYSNGNSLNYADEGGWAGGLVDLLSTTNRTEHQTVLREGEGDFENLVTVIRTKLLGKAFDHDNDFSLTDLYADLDGFGIMKGLDSTSYQSGSLTALLKSYFTSGLSANTRAASLLAYRFDGVVGRNELREAVYSAYTANSRISSLESTRTFNNIDNLAIMRRAVCYAFADYLCGLAGDWSETNGSVYLTEVEKTTSTLAPGVTMEIHTATTIDEEQIVYTLGYIDVSRSGLKVMAVNYSRDPQEWRMARVVDQAEAAAQYHNSAEGELHIANMTPIMAINGGPHDMTTGEPTGLLLMHGTEYHAVDGNGFFGIRRDGSAVIGTMADYEAMKADLTEGISGAGVMLITDGVIRCESPIADFSSGRDCRTAVGITTTGRVVFMTLDGRQQPRSVGGTTFEAARIMKEAGCVDAILLEGGSMTTFAARQAGTTELKVVNQPSDGVPRSIATALVVASTEHEWAYGTVTVEPTLISDGEMQYSCIHCGAVKTETIARGIVGDANEDGEADMTDSVDMLEWFCESPVELNLGNTDVNGDGVTDMLDVAILALISSGESVDTTSSTK